MENNDINIINNSMSPDDTSKVANLNSELYKLSADKDAIYTQMANIQKQIEDIKQRYNKSSYNATPNNQDVTQNIMESGNLRIKKLSDYMSEDNRPASLIEFSDKDENSNNKEEIKNEFVVDNESGKTEYVRQPDVTSDVIYVSFVDNGRKVIGKVFKRDEKSDWETKVVKGESDTFEEMAFVKDLRVYGVLDKIEDFYDDVNIIKKEVFDKTVIGENYNFNFLTYNL